jgi:hypothetical protein
MAGVRSLLAFEQRIGQATGLKLRDWFDSSKHDQFVGGGPREVQGGRPPSQQTEAPAVEKEREAAKSLQAEFDNAMEVMNAEKAIRIIERARDCGIKLMGIEDWLPIVAEWLLDPDRREQVGELQELLLEKLEGLRRF